MASRSLRLGLFGALLALFVFSRPLAAQAPGEGGDSLGAPRAPTPPPEPRGEDPEPAEESPLAEQAPAEQVPAEPTVAGPAPAEPAADEAPPVEAGPDADATQGSELSTDELAPPPPPVNPAGAPAIPEGYGDTPATFGQPLILRPPQVAPPVAFAFDPTERLTTLHGRGRIGGLLLPLAASVLLTGAALMAANCDRGGDRGCRAGGVLGVLGVAGWGAASLTLAITANKARKTLRNAGYRVSGWAGVMGIVLSVIPYTFALGWIFSWIQMGTNRRALARAEHGRVAPPPPAPPPTAPIIVTGATAAAGDVAPLARY